MASVHDRVVLVTGAAGGIGSALCRRLAERGARLALADRDEVGLARLAAELGTGTIHGIDLLERDAPERLVAAVVAAHGELSVVVCNAGLTVHGAFSQLTAAEVDRVLEVDLRSVLHLVRCALPHVRQAPSGHVVLMSSMAGLQPFPHQSAYSAAKAGLAAFGEVARMELAVDGIGVTTVFPGTIATEFIARGGTHDPETTAWMAKMMRRGGTSPDRVARATVRAVERNRARVRVGLDCHLVALTRWLAPPVLPHLLGLATRRFMGSRP